MRERILLPETMLDELASDYWARKPGAWRRPVEPPLFDADDAFRVLCESTRRFDQLGVSTYLPRVFLDGQTRGFDLTRDAARPDDGDLAGFIAALRGRIGEAELGLVQEDVPAMDFGVWTRATAFLRALYRRVGMPPGGAHSEIFFGNYRRAFFKLHKDSLDTFTFVLHGRKRFLVWPYEVFADHPELPGDFERGQHMFEALDEAPWRDRALVLEGGPGDVFFWPASWWHLAESVDGDYAVTLTLAVAPSSRHAPGSPFRMLEDASTELFEQSAMSEDPPLGSVITEPEQVGEAMAMKHAEVRRHLDEPALDAAWREQALIWLSAAGFRRVPDRLPLPEIAAEDTLICSGQRPILWSEVSDEGFSCAVNGIVLTALPMFLPLVRRLNAGGRLPVATLLAELCGGEGQPGEDELLEALQHLAAARAFELAPRTTEEGANQEGPTQRG